VWGSGIYTGGDVVYDKLKVIQNGSRQTELGNMSVSVRRKSVEFV
jgi:hypothetical protein